MLGRIAEALERLAPPPPSPSALAGHDAFIWQPEGCLRPAHTLTHIQLDLLRGIDAQKTQLLANTRLFAQGYAANNALLWGARGTGKSSLVKSVFCAVNARLSKKRRLALIEIQRDDMGSLPALLAILRQTSRRCVLFCDDLSFGDTDTHYKALKSLLDGGIEGPPGHILFYATSNLRHLTPREQDTGGPLAPADAVDERISLSDRFGLWLGFHALDQGQYLEIVTGYASAYGLSVSAETLRRDSLEWARTRGGLSGRVAWQYITSQAGKLATPLHSD